MIIRTPDEVHTAVFMPPGGGKTAGLLIPGLLADRRNAVVLDPQGAIFSATSEARRRRFGHEIVRIDTAGICGPGGDGFNPFDYLIATSPTLYSDCRNLANQLVMRKGTETDPHWPNRAEDVLTVISYFIAKYETKPDRRNLLAVRQAVGSPDAFLATCNVMKQMPGLAGELGGSMDWLKDKELNSVQSVVSSHIGWMASPIVAESLKRTDFDINTLKNGRMTIYVIEHPANLETNAGHLRVILGTILGVTTRGKASEAAPIRYVIDEAAALGRIKILENAVTQLRGYGVRLVLAYQSVGQLRQCYGDNAQTMLDSIGTQIYASPRSFDTLEHISKLIGDTTITIQSVNHSVGWSHQSKGGGGPGGDASRSETTATNTSEHGRRLWKEEELRQLPPSLALVMHANLPVVPVKLERYFDSPLFAGGGPFRPGLGLAGSVAAGFFLLVALMLSLIVADLPPPAVQPAAPQAAWPSPALTRQRPPWQRTYPVPASRRNRNDRLPSRSGYLIPIR